MVTRDLEMHVRLEEKRRQYDDINREAWKYEEVEPRLRRLAYLKRR